VGSPGYLRATVEPDKVMVEYVHTYLPKDENTEQQNGEVDHKYIIMH